MKKIRLFLILFILALIPCISEVRAEDIDNLPKTIVFVYHIPDDEPEVQEDNNVQEEVLEDIVSDDVTADTSRKPSDEENLSEEENDEEYTAEDELDNLYSDVLQGYAQYTEDEENTISLEDLTDEILTVNIRRPFRVQSEKFSYSPDTSLKFNNNLYSKYNGAEYNISPLSSTNYRQKGGFSAGTMYNQGIDYGEFEQSSGIFSRYSYKNFAISTAYMKTVNSTNNNYNDNFYFSPEWRLNQYISLKETLSADITRERRKAEFMISINPFGNKDEDRLRLELGANQTYDYNNVVLRNQVKFSTRFKL